LTKAVTILLDKTTTTEKFQNLFELIDCDDPNEANDVLMARLVRNNPDIFTTRLFWGLCFIKRAEFFWDQLIHFGLPMQALEPFCSGITKQINNADRGRLYPMLEVITTSKKSYPWFDFKSKLPEIFNIDL